MVRSLLLGSGLLAGLSVLHPVDASQASPCPTTASTNPPPFFAPPPYSTHAPSPDAFWYGSKELWTMLRHNGRWGALRLADGAYRNKVFMWRQGYDSRIEQRPALTLTALRLDEPGPIVQVSEATNASSKGIGSAMLTAANLPAAGCWEFTAHYGREMLTFVVSVP